MDRADAFEASYNFRHEEPEGREGPKTYPRDMPSVRNVKQTTRQRARARKKEQKMAEKLRLDEELKKLKAEKRKEILEKLRGSEKEKITFDEGEEEEDMRGRLEQMGEEELERYLDEYLQIDYEDVAGVKARFRYEKVRKIWI